MISKAQASLETTISFLVILSLFFGIIAMWIWGDRQIAKRQPPYKSSRLAAGKPSRQPGGTTPPKSLIYPVYTPETLREEEVHF